MKHYTYAHATTDSIKDSELVRLRAVNTELLAALKKLYKDRSGRIDEEIRAVIAKAESQSCAKSPAHPKQ